MGFQSCDIDQSPCLLRQKKIIKTTAARLACILSLRSLITVLLEKYFGIVG